MSSTVFITGADRGLGYGLCQAFLAKGWKVFAGQYLSDWIDLDNLKGEYPEQLKIVPLDVADEISVQDAARVVAQNVQSLDLLINNAGILSPTYLRSIQEHPDYVDMLGVYNVNTLGALRMVEAFLPLVSRSKMKRLGFVSSEAGSIGASERKSWFGYCMSKAALNMAVKILFNDLRPLGFTVRLYHPGWIRSYMSGKKNMDAHLEPEEGAEKAMPFFVEPRADEDHLALVDFEGKEWPW
jgi:NAD(P)-dependent dehydrogenase (short-subunit alcohol dehydrogenase family)